VSTGIPDKTYLRIGEVSALTGLPASVLRYWESEFASLETKKSSKGQRLYTHDNVQQVAEIKKLLYAEKLTIEGARQRIEVKKRYRKPELTRESLALLLEDVKQDLLALRDQL
jgi:DNA-binding transcriptional MerR regulator